LPKPFGYTKGFFIVRPGRAAAGVPEQRAVESAFNGHGPWWNRGASHMNHAFPKRYFQKLELVSLLEKLWITRKQ
jgi:RNA-directed DNA polymerase